MNKNALIRTLGVVILIVTLLATGITILFFWNQLILNGLANDFEGMIENAEGVELIETKSVYGNLNGNGNNINYFAAALVTADSEEDLKALVETLGKHFDVAGYDEHIGTKVENKYLERPDLYFDTEPSEGTYTVYFFNSSHPKSNLLDIKGH